MAKRLWTTSALAVVVMMLVSACASSTTSPTPAASAAASASAAAAPQRAARRAERGGFGPARGRRSGGPDRLHRAGRRPSAPTSRSTARRSRSRPSGSVARARTSPRRSPTSRRRPASRSRSTASARATRPCSRPASRAASRRTWRCSPSRRAVLAYAEEGKVIDVATFMDAAKLKTEHPATIGLVTDGDHIWGIPYKADVKSTIWYPIKAFEAKGYTVPKTWDELIALSDKIVADGSNPWCVSAGGRRRRRAGRSPTGSRKSSCKTKGLDTTTSGSATSSRSTRPEIKAAFDKVGKIFFSPTTSPAAAPAIMQHRPDDADGPDVQRRHWRTRAAGCRRTRPGTARTSSRMSAGQSGAALEVRRSARTSASSTSRPSTRPRGNAEGSADTLMVARRIGPKVRPSPSSSRRRRASSAGSRRAAPSRPTPRPRPRGTGPTS